MRNHSLEEEIVLASGASPREAPMELRKLRQLSSAIARVHGPGYNGIIEAMNTLERTAYPVPEHHDIRPHLNALLQGNPLYRDDQCISLSALFTCLAAEQGLAPTIMAHPGHVWVKYDGREYDPSSPFTLLPDKTKQTAELPASAMPGILWEIRGRVDYECGNKDGALQHFTHAIEASPDLPGPYTWRGRVLMETGKSEEAKSDLDTAVRMAPNYELPYRYRARLALIENEPARALALLNEAARYSTNKDSRRLKACALAMQGRPVDAFVHRALAVFA